MARAGRRGVSASDAPDRPSPLDVRLLRSARARARRKVVVAEAVLLARRIDAFRDELAATVRSASPFLAALLGEAGVDRAVEVLEPGRGWPVYAGMGRGSGFSAAHHSLRRYYASDGRGLGHRAPRSGERGRTAVLAGGSEVIVQVVNHSVEASLRLGGAHLETGFGLLRIELDQRLPDTLVAALSGRPVDAVVDHASLRGRGWTIAAVEEDEESFFGPVLLVATGASPYVVPWAR